MMKFCLLAVSIFCGAAMLSSCAKNGYTNAACREAVSKCYKLSTINGDKKSLDSALTIANAFIHCDSSRIVLVDLKIRILFSLARYEECSKFVDSLSEKDFRFPYKKQSLAKYLSGVKFLEARDTLSYKRQLHESAEEIEGYLNSRSLASAEIQDIFLDLYAIKKQYLDSSLIRREIDSLKFVYPEQASFFNFLQ